MAAEVHERRRRVMLLLGAVVMAACLAGCRQAGGDAVLAELVKDPMASRSQPGAALTTTDDIPKSNGGLIFKKPRATQVLRAFAPQGQSAEDLYGQLVASAQAGGWRLQQKPNSSQGTKQFSFGEATIHIDVNPYVSPVQVSVVLEPVG
jgi:hypothetical protein